MVVGLIAMLEGLRISNLLVVLEEDWLVVEKENTLAETQVVEVEVVMVVVVVVVVVDKPKEIRFPDAQLVQGSTAQAASKKIRIPDAQLALDLTAQAVLKKTNTSHLRNSQPTEEQVPEYHS